MAEKIIDAATIEQAKSEKWEKIKYSLKKFLSEYGVKVTITAVIFTIFEILKSRSGMDAAGLFNLLILTVEGSASFLTGGIGGDIIQDVQENWEAEKVRLKSIIEAEETK